MKPTVNKRQEIVKIKEQIIEKENRKTIENVDKTKSWFLEINKIDKPLTTLIRKKRENTQIANIYNEINDIATDSIDIQMIIRVYYTQLPANKFCNLDEMDIFHERHTTNLIQEEIGSMSHPININ